MSRKYPRESMIIDHGLVIIKSLCKFSWRPLLFGPLFLKLNNVQPLITGFRSLGIKRTKVPTFQLTATVRKIWLTTTHDANMTVATSWKSSFRGPSITRPSLASIPCITSLAFSHPSQILASKAINFALINKWSRWLPVSDELKYRQGW